MAISNVDIPIQEHKEDAKAKRVVIVDKNGNLIDASNPLPVTGGGSGGGGVQYTEGDVDESITGTAALAEGPSNVLYPLQLDENGFLKVNVVAGGAGGGVAQTQVRDSSNNWKDVGYYTNNLYMPVSIQADNTGTKDVNITNDSITVTASDFDIRNLDSSTDSVSAVQSGSWSVTVSNTVTVTATDLDIRDLNYTSDSVSAYQAGTWNINSIVETVDVNVTNTSITVTATDLDIRDLSYNSDSVTAYQGGSWTVSVGNTVTVTATDLDIRDLSYSTDSVTSYQGGTWNVNSIVNPVTVQATDLDIRNLSHSNDSISAYQAGSWNVGKNQYTTLLAYDSNGNLEYVGFASPGSSSSQAVWRIIKLSYDANGNLVSVKYADGNDNFDNVWDDRESYSYS